MLNNWVKYIVYNFKKFKDFDQMQVYKNQLTETL